MAKNWKSTAAFFAFVVAYLYTVWKAMDSSVIEISGYIALWSSLFMMLRNELTPKIIEKMLDTITKKGG